MRAGPRLAAVRHDRLTVMSTHLVLLFEQADGAQLELIRVM